MGFFGMMPGTFKYKNIFLLPLGLRKGIMLSNAAKYAIRAILYLSIHSDESHKIGAKKIAEALETPQPFLAQLLRTLTTNKIISSTKGPGGGFYLDAQNGKMSVWDVINCIDGTHKFDACFLGLSKCNDENPCPAHYMVSPFKKKVMGDFKDKTIFQLASEIKEKGTLISLKDFN